MRALVQRVSQASVVVDDNRIVSQIGRGLLVFLGVGRNDTLTDADYLARKIANLRVFPDKQGKMNCNVRDTGGELLIVPQFTLYGETSKGNRASYSSAARPEIAKPLYEQFVNVCRDGGLSVGTGLFGAHMDVHLINVGPVTLFCSSESELHQHENNN